MASPSKNRITIMPEFTRTLTQYDAGKTISLLPGDLFELVLQGNPTAGYQWEAGSYDAAIIKPVEGARYARSSNSLGAGGVFRFAFQALAPGGTYLKLVYRRPFEKETPPLRDYTVFIEVATGKNA